MWVLVKTTFPNRHRALLTERVSFGRGFSVCRELVLTGL
jgi:hypothetical protein